MKSLGCIEVIKPGLLDLVMDLGRPGWGAQGLPAGGAADARALVAANRLLGNPDSAAGLELLGFGPTLGFPQGGRVALGGGEIEASMEGVPISAGQQVQLFPGATLCLGRILGGCRAYLAVAGGIAAPCLLGGRSSFLPGGFGGHDGRALKMGDRLALGTPQDKAKPRLLPVSKTSVNDAIRVLPAAQIGGFADEALTAMAKSAYRVLPDSNRVGLRLAGKPLHYFGEELPSQGVLPGAIQVPPDGQPIILGWDGPVTGGYPVIAAVIAADLPKLAQLSPGDAVRFVFVTRSQALAIWREEGWA